jgi:ribosome-binding ATPase YchF (GTP1/OBG family)
MNIKRNIFEEIKNHLSKKEITLIVGPRQVGKTTIMQELIKYLNEKEEVIDKISAHFKAPVDEVFARIEKIQEENKSLQKELVQLQNVIEQVISVNVKNEEEIAALPEEEQEEYIKELGLEQSGLDKLITAAYKILGLDTFFTTGPDESRAWTIKSGTKAPQAAGVIHTDFIKGFVRAEVIQWDKFIEAGSDAKARELGLIRTEGKDYIVKDGDICNFLINK